MMMDSIFIPSSCFSTPTCRGIHHDPGGGTCHLLYDTTDVPQNERSNYNVTSLTADGKKTILVKGSLFKGAFVTERIRSMDQGNVFTQVCHSVHRGGGVEGVWCRGVDACLGCLPGECLPEGVSVEEVCTLLPRWLLLRTVRILLECILVLQCQREKTVLTIDYTDILIQIDNLALLFVTKRILLAFSRSMSNIQISRRRLKIIMLIANVNVILWKMKVTLIFMNSYSLYYW